MLMMHNFFEGNNSEQTELASEKTMPKIVDWLKKSGMLGNVSKTETCLSPGDAKKNFML